MTRNVAILLNRLLIHFSQANFDEVTDAYQEVLNTYAAN